MGKIEAPKRYLAVLSVVRDGHEELVKQPFSGAHNDQEAREGMERMIRELFPYMSAYKDAAVEIMSIEQIE